MDHPSLSTGSTPLSDCTHRISTVDRSTGRLADPTRCTDCGASIGGRDMRPAWEHALSHGRTDTYPHDWGYGDAASWFFSDFSTYRPGRLAGAILSGGLPHCFLHGDLRLDADIAANTARIVELKHFVDAMGASAPPSLSPGAWDTLPPSIREMRLTYFQILGWCARQLVNAIRWRGGDYDGIVRSTARRETPFSGLRHALQVAFTEESQLGPRSKHPSGVLKHSIPSGIVFGQIACEPTRSGSEGAQGEDHLLGRLAVVDALHTARVGQQHVLDENGALVVNDAGGSPLTPAHIELLRLVLVGHDRGTAKVEHHSVVPAVEELPVREALQRLHRRSLRLQGTPETEHQARLLLKEARLAVADQLFVFGLIPSPDQGRRRRLPASTSDASSNPFALPGAS